MRIQRCLLASLMAAVVSVAPLQSSLAQDHVEVGVLTCEQVGTRINLIIHSTANVKCEFTDTEGNVERYMGETGVGLGIDLQWKKEEHMAFTVLASVGANANEHALTGKYVGGGASAALGAGLGAAVLVGGSADQFSLQPIAISGSIGIGAAAGVTYLYIQPATQ